MFFGNFTDKDVLWVLMEVPTSTRKIVYFKTTVEPRYLEFAYFELPLISKWKSGPCFNMKIWQQVTK